MDDRLKAYTDLYIHWDSTYWYAFYVFLILQGSFIVAFTQVFINEKLPDRPNFLFIISMSGLALSLIWLFVMNRKMTYTLGAQEQLKTQVPMIYESAHNLQTFSWKKPRTYLTWMSSALLVHTVFPILFIAFWILSLSVIN